MVRASAVTKVYRTDAVEVPALRGVDLIIGRGDFVAVMGPSGCGKTTLLNCLSGLDSIDGGTVTVDGMNIHAMNDARRTEHRAHKMGFIFQTYNLIPVLSAIENVELPLLLIGVGPSKARTQARQMLAQLGLGARQDHRPGQLSGGEQQRVAIGRALITQPAVVWADEPTGNLDSQMATSIVDLLREIHAAGQAIVVVTHDTWVARSARRLVRMRDGVVVDDGTPVELLGALPE